MSEPEDFEAFLADRLRDKAETVTAPAGAVSTIVRRSHRRRTRHRAAGVLAGAGALLLGGAAITRSDVDDVVTVGAEGPGGGSTSTPGSTPGSVPSSTVPPMTATTATTVPTTAGPPFVDTGLGLVPDPAGGSLLSSDLRIDIEPSTRLADGATVTVRGSRFPAGAQLVLIECTTHGLGAATLEAGAGWCDIGSQLSVMPAPGATMGPDGSTPDVGEDGTFTSTYTVKRNLSTMGGAYDCALGGLSAEAGVQLRELHEAGTLGPASFPEGVYGCSVVAVVEEYVPIGGGSYRVDYAAATAQILHFDPDAAPVPPTTTTSTTMWMPDCDDPPPNYRGPCRREDP
jgi:hypothetical protein